MFLSTLLDLTDPESLKTKWPPGQSVAANHLQAHETWRGRVQPAHHHSVLFERMFIQIPIAGNGQVGKCDRATRGSAQVQQVCRPCHAVIAWLVALKS
jgi:hypothetical protein